MRNKNSSHTLIFVSLVLFLVFLIQFPAVSDQLNELSSFLPSSAVENNNTAEEMMFVIGDRIFLDSNQNGQFDSNELGYNGVMIELFDNGTCTGTPIQSKQSSGDGNYVFLNVVTGTYCMRYSNLPLGWQFTDANSSSDDTIDSDPTPDSAGRTALLQNIEVTSNLVTLDAGVYPGNRPNDDVFTIVTDLMESCVQAGQLFKYTVYVMDNEPASEVNRILFEGSYSQGLDMKGSNATDGHVTFDPLNNAIRWDSIDTIELGKMYRLELTFEVLQDSPCFMDLSGYLTKNPLNLTPSIQLEYDEIQRQTVVLDTPECKNEVASIGDRVWHDVNQDGVQGDDEPGIGPLKVYLFQDMCPVSGETAFAYRTTVTDGEGNYLFEPLPPGDYCVVFGIPSNYEATSANAGGNDTLDSDANPDGITSVISLSGGEHNDTIDAGLFLKGASAMADIVVSKTVDNETPSVGETVTWTITARNNGPQAASSVQVSDMIPNGLTITNVQTSKGVYSAPLWDIGNLLQDEVVTLQITTQVNQTGSIKNTAQVSNSSLPDPNTSNNMGMAMINAPVESLDLAVFKTVNTITPTLGDEVIFTISVVNNAAIEATGVQVQDVLPDGLSFISANTSHGSFANDVWEVGTLAPNQTVMLQIVALTTQVGTVTNTAALIHVDQDDSNSSNNQSSVSVHIDEVMVDPMADLCLTKTVEPAIANEGDLVTFTVSVINNGPDEATNIQISDVIPQGLIYAGHSTTHGNYDSSTGSWNIASLSVGSTAILLFQAILAEGTAGGQVTNVASLVSTDQVDPNDSNNVASARVFVLQRQAYDLAVYKSSDNPVPVPGTVVNFTIEVINNGPTTAHDVVVTDLLPNGLTYVSSILGNSQTYNPSNGIWTVGTLGSGERRSIVLRTILNGNAQQGIYNTATVGCEGQFTCNDQDLSNNVSTTVVTLTECSSCNNGGIESTGDDVLALATAIFGNKTLQSKTESPTKALGYLVGLRKYEISLPSNTVEKQQNLKNSTSSMAQFLPEFGPHQTTAVDVSPTWLVEETNALEVLGIDYLYPNTNKRLAGVLGLKTAGELYNHTKNVCDRLGGSVLQEVKTLMIHEHPFVVSGLVQGDQFMDYSMPINIYETAQGYVVDNRFNFGDYAIPSGTQTVYNFQVWGASPNYVGEMASTIITRLKQLGTVSFLNTRADMPQVFVRTGAYKNGKFEIEVVNRVGAQSITLNGSVGYSESEANAGFRESFSQVIALNPNQQVQTVTLETGFVFDASVQLVDATGDISDEIYFADGAWGNNPNQGKITQFDVQRHSVENDAVGYNIFERNIHVTGETSGTGASDFVSVFRYLKSGWGRQAYDASTYDFVEFWAYGTGELDVIMHQQNQTSSENFSKRITLSPSGTKHRIYFFEFRKSSGDPFIAKDLDYIAFNILGDGQTKKSFDVKLQGVNFGNSLVNEEEDTLPSEITLHQNYPNPFNPSTTISFELAQHATISLEVFDVLGKKIATLATGAFSSGIHQISFDAQDLPSGVYIYRLKAGDTMLSQKMLLMK